MNKKLTLLTTLAASVLTQDRNYAGDCLDIDVQFGWVENCEGGCFDDLYGRYVEKFPAYYDEDYQDESINDGREVDYEYGGDDYYGDQNYYGDYYLPRKIRQHILTQATGTKDFAFKQGAVLYGLDDLDIKGSVWCNHTHLYSFQYDNVQPFAYVDSFLANMEATQQAMVGFPGLCSVSNIGSGAQLHPGDTYATSGDQFAWTCGYYVELEWSGYDWVYFEIYTNGALDKAKLGSSAFLLWASLMMLLP